MTSDSLSRHASGVARLARRSVFETQSVNREGEEGEATKRETGKVKPCCVAKKEIGRTWGRAIIL